MRGLVDGLSSPHPLSETLPSMLREDPFAQQLCASFDDVLAPVVLTLDTFPSYLDPALAPEDMLPWLSRWLGLGVDPTIDPTRQRHDLQIAGMVNVTRGTRRSIEIALESALGMPVEVVESGGSRWSPSPGGELPGEPGALLAVTVRPPQGVEVDVERVDALIRSVKPAHVRHRVVVSGQ